MKDIMKYIYCGFDRFAARFRLALIFLLILALVMAPYAFDASKGKFAKVYAIAKDDDSDGGGDDGGRSRRSGGKKSAEAEGRDRTGDKGRRFMGVGDMDDLTPVSAEDEEGLVGNWGEPKAK